MPRHSPLSSIWRYAESSSPTARAMSSAAIPRTIRCSRKVLGVPMSSAGEHHNTPASAVSSGLVGAMAPRSQAATMSGVTYGSPNEERMP